MKGNFFFLYHFYIYFNPLVNIEVDVVVTGWRWREKWKIDNKIIVFTLLSFTELLLLRSKDAKPTEECFFNKTVLLGFRTYTFEK